MYHSMGKITSQDLPQLSKKIVNKIMETEHPGYSLENIENKVQTTSDTLFQSYQSYFYTNPTKLNQWLTSTN
jgi:chromosome segregation and condensation protein ScpB